MLLYSPSFPGVATINISTFATHEDTVLYDYRLGWQGNPYADNRAYAESLAKLSRFALDGTPVRFDLLLPGHGCMSMDKAYLDVRKAREQVEADVAAGRDIRATPFSNPDYRRKMSGRAASTPEPRTLLVP